MRKCNLTEQSFQQGSCQTFYKTGKNFGQNYLADRACEVTLKWDNDIPFRQIKSVLLSRPEDYLSIYQSGCNMSCLKCHSWEFSQYKNGTWMSPADIVDLAAEYAKFVTVKEPKERATSFHAHDLCKHCGQCVTKSKRPQMCPRKLTHNQILFSPQGLGPARNIIAFTGGDLTCQPDWYCRVARKIKEAKLDLWILLETNGYGLTPRNLDLFKEAGIDSFWLDIKAWWNNTHKKLTGVDNYWILRLPEEILKRDFTLEVLSLFIPGWVESDQLSKIAILLSKLNREIPFTILAFFGEYKMEHVPSPNLHQMIDAYSAAKESGLKNIRLGNIGIFVKTEEDFKTISEIAKDSI